jgi:hypothetical protein
LKGLVDLLQGSARDLGDVPELQGMRLTDAEQIVKMLQNTTRLM